MKTSAPRSRLKRARWTTFPSKMKQARQHRAVCFRHGVSHAVLFLLKKNVCVGAVSIPDTGVHRKDAVRASRMKAKLYP